MDLICSNGAQGGAFESPFSTQSSQQHVPFSSAPYVNHLRPRTAPVLNDLLSSSSSSSLSASFHKPLHLGLFNNFHRPSRTLKPNFYYNCHYGDASESYYLPAPYSVLRFPPQELSHSSLYSSSAFNGGATPAERLHWQRLKRFVLAPWEDLPDSRSKLYPVSSLPSHDACRYSSACLTLIRNIWHRRTGSGYDTHGASEMSKAQFLELKQRILNILVDRCRAKALAAPAESPGGFHHSHYNNNQNQQPHHRGFALQPQQMFCLRLHIVEVRDLDPSSVPRSPCGLPGKR